MSVWIAPRAIDTPSGKEIRLACEWHGGMSSMLYAVASTGALMRGMVRPHGVDTEAGWEAYLAWKLSRELRDVVIAAPGIAPGDGPIAAAWADRMESIVEALEASS